MLQFLGVPNPIQVHRIHRRRSYSRMGGRVAVFRTALDRPEIAPEEPASERKSCGEGCWGGAVRGDAGDHAAPGVPPADRGDDPQTAGG